MQSLRELPSVEQVLRRLTRFENLPRKLVVDEIRSVLETRRKAYLNGNSQQESSVEDAVSSRLDALLNLSLRRVINATGVILHTNLGRAPLSGFKPIFGYSDLEYDLVSGKRGKRDNQVVPLLERLLGAPAIVVNNNAAAVFLTLNELAAGAEAVVSRGELIEIGDGFRIPEIMERAGVVLREVGTTNRTSIEDYASAINDRTRLILRVHPSNFHISGFTSKPSLQHLAALGRERGIPVYEDGGSGSLVDLRAHGIREPRVQESLEAGVSVVSFSCDKLFGGPQTGIIAGDEAIIQRIRRNPIYRALRVDKLILQSLQTTLHHLLREDWETLPTLRMITAPLDNLRARAERILAQLEQLKLDGLKGSIRQSESPIGGGSTPDQSLPTWVIELNVANPVSLEQHLRGCPTPVVARIERDRIILDMRTVSDDEENLLVTALLESVRGS